MTSALLLALALSPGSDRSLGPVAAPAEAPYGYTYFPARDLDRIPRYPALRYDPHPADVLLLSDPNLFWRTIYAIALTGVPGHVAIVVRQPDGRLGLLESGFNETLWTRLAPLDYRINQYPGAVWVRRVRIPLTPDQDARLTTFAAQVDNTRYNLLAAKLNLTPFRLRGPLRTTVLARPRGPDHPMYCSEVVLEALVFAGLIDAETTRPRATFPRDMFFDSSPNPYINHHPPLAYGWDTPALWTPVLGWAMKGKERPPVDGVVLQPPPTTRTSRRGRR
jgi:hypothetical protein